MSEKLKTSIEIFHDNDVYPDRRTVCIIGDIDKDMFETVFKNLHILDAVNKPINVIINSSGGDVTQGKAIYDAIKGCQSHVTALVYGEACSAASFILQAADDRFATPSSKIMVHVGSEGLEDDHPRNIDSQYRELRLDEAWLENVYLKNIRKKKKRFTRHQMKSMLQYDRYFSPKEAMELNLITDIKESL